jgi:hypothetical protein
MKLTIEISNLPELRRVLDLLKELDIEKVEVLEEKSTIQKGDKSIGGEGLFGIWSDRPRDLKEIRSANWERNWAS